MVWNASKANHDGVCIPWWVSRQAKSLLSSESKSKRTSPCIIFPMFYNSKSKQADFLKTTNIIKYIKIQAEAKNQINTCSIIPICSVSGPCHYHLPSMESTISAFKVRRLSLWAFQEIPWRTKGCSSVWRVEGINVGCSFALHRKAPQSVSRFCVKKAE